MKNKNQQKYAIKEDQPVDWFETLYANANTKGEGVPWANMTTHPLFEQWLVTHALQGEGKSAMVVGCGMGDDAIELEKRGFTVTAFDVSHTAIKHCKARFPNSCVDFMQSDILKEQHAWQQAFDFVLEIYTVQALPPKYEKQVIDNISSLVAPKGKLLLIAEVGNNERSFENGPPWLLTPGHVDSFVSNGLQVIDQHTETTQNKTHKDETTTYTTLLTKTSGSSKQL